MLDELYENEVEYTKDIYDQVGLSEQVLDFIRYNANKALQNIGRDEYFEHGKINPIVENGLKTVTKQHDFFSKKSNGYMKAINIEQMQEEDFDY
jgi:ribonucleoside-diphosphate reductase beta chain